MAYARYLIGLFGSFVFAYAGTMLFVHSSKMVILDREYSMWLYVKNVMHAASPHPQDLILIGDSRAKAGYIPKLSDRKTINLSLAGQTPLEGYYVLANYLKNNPPPARLVVSYAPFHLSVADGFWEMTVKYDFLSFAEYNEAWDTSFLLEDKVLGEKDKRWRYLLLPSTYWDSLRRAIKEPRWHTNQETYSQVMESYGHYYYGKEPGATDLNQEIQKGGTFGRSRMLEYYLVKLIHLAQTRNIDVYWYTMPFSEISCKNMPESFKRDFEQYIATLQITTGIKLINTLSCLPDDLFGDSNHVYLGAQTTTFAILKGVFGQQNLSSMVTKSESRLPQSIGPVSCLQSAWRGFPFERSLPHDESMAAGYVRPPRSTHEQSMTLQ